MERKSFSDIRAEQDAKREAKAAGREVQRAEKVAGGDMTHATPVEQAVAAREDGQGFFEVQLEVGTSQRDQTLFGSIGKSKRNSHAGTLAAIEAAGWRLEHVGYVYQVTGESSRNRAIGTGQSTAVSGVTVGIYLFRAAED
jgi:hypothetical protein